MSFFKKLFGSKPQPPPPSAGTPTVSKTPTPPVDPAQDPNLIRVFDAYGREMFITRQAWRDSVLLGHIQKVWHDPDALYSTIAQALRDGFAADLLPAAERLVALEPASERGPVVLAIVHRQLKRPAEAARLLEAHLARHGLTGVLLTNLAQAQADLGQKSVALATLWRGLELDPNQDNAVLWYESTHRETEGPAAGLAALRRIAALSGAWRARLWLARDALTRRALDEALALYHEALALAPRPVPIDLLQQLSGDLGNHGHLPEILQLVAPHFDIAHHGLAVGNNLIKANLDLGRLDAARALIEQHYAQNRLDWKSHLAFWETELAKADVESKLPGPPPNFSLLRGEAPIWLPSHSPAAELFPALEPDAVRVAFIGGTAATPATTQGKPAHQLSDAIGRLSRALPFFLAEQAHFGAATRTVALVPWVIGDGITAFALSGAPWSDTDAAAHARIGEAPCDYVVVTHLQATAEPLTAELRLIRTIDAQCLATTTVAFTFATIEAPLRQLAREFLPLLAQHAGVTLQPMPAAYSVPGGNDFGQYLLRLEQLLAARCATINGVSPNFLHGERELVEGMLHLCLSQPANVVPRLILAETLLKLKKLRPAIVEENRPRIGLLQQEKPLPTPAHGIVERIFHSIYS